MSEMVTLWLVVLIVSIGVEVATLGLTSIWFAGGAVVAVIAAALQAPIWLQILLFFAVSLLLLFFTRPVAVRYFNKDRVRTNVESMIGRQAIVTSEIDNLQGIGQVTVGGQERQNRKRRTESTARNGGRHRGSQWCQADRQGGSADDEGHRGSTGVTELRIV